MSTSTAQKKQGIGQRMRIAREHAGLTGADVARRLGVSKASVSNWETKGVGDADIIFDYAAVVNADAIWLFSGARVDNATPVDGVSVRSVPLMTILQYTNADPAAVLTARARVHTKVSALAFALEIADAANSPDLEEGDIVVLDPAVPPQPGALVLALTTDQRPIIGRLRQLEDGNVQVCPVNGHFAPVTIRAEQQGRVVATLIETTRILRLR